jgi:hypothetical protein
MLELCLKLTQFKRNKISYSIFIFLFSFEKNFQTLTKVLIFWTKINSILSSMILNDTQVDSFFLINSLMNDFSIASSFLTYI